ncbi:MAG: tetratricopeptide repeat protein [Kiritimatiellia bacterium]
MKSCAPCGALRVWLAAVLLWAAAFSLACRLLEMPPPRSEAGRNFASMVFGGVRAEVSEGLFGQADLVYHKGVRAAPRMKKPDWFARMRLQSAPYGHRHLRDDDIVEIMPWLYLATRVDPGNMTAYSVAAYWLAGAAGRPELAEEVLNEALRNNPGDYRAYMEKGRLAMKLGQYSKSARYLDAALARLPGAAGVDGEQKRHDGAEMLVYLGLAREILGAPLAAARCYRAVLELFPGRLKLQERMLALEKTGHSPSSPEEQARAMLYRHGDVCAQAEDH